MPADIPLSTESVLAALRAPLLAVSFPVIWSVIGIGSALVACGLVYAHLVRQRGRKPAAAVPVEKTPARSAFDELADGHRLSTDEVQLLRQAAEQLGLSQPVLLFVDPGLLERFDERCETGSAAHALRRKLFGNPPEQNADPAPSIDQVDAVLLNALPQVESASPEESAPPADGPSPADDLANREPERAAGRRAVTSVPADSEPVR